MTRKEERIETLERRLKEERGRIGLIWEDYGSDEMKQEQKAVKKEYHDES